MTTWIGHKPVLFESAVFLPYSLNSQICYWITRYFHNFWILIDLTQCAFLPRQKPWHIYNPPCRVGYVSYVHEILSESLARYQQQQYTMGNFNLVSLIWSKILLPSNSLDRTTNTEFGFTNLKTNTMRTNLLNWCNLVLISKNVVFYVFLVVRIY